MSDRVDVTVAICTWNRADVLAQTLTSLGGLTVPPGLTWELVVVDNNSPDHTRRVLAEHAAAGVLPLRTGFEPAQGQSHARNHALGMARGGLLLWTDDDVQVDPGWLAGFAAAAARHPTAAAFGGPIDPWFPVPPDPDLVAACYYLRQGYCGLDHGPAERELAADEDVFGANMGYRVGLTGDMRFDPGLGRKGVSQAGGDDLDFLNRARARGPAVYAPGMRLKHYVAPERMTLAYVRRYTYEIAGVPARDDRTPRLFGAPRWLVRQYLDGLVGGWVNRLRGRRAERLAALMKRWRAGALIRAYRRQAKGAA